jgi:catechol-2,3-dioxygenase
MTIQHDSDLPPLNPKIPPAVPVEALLAINDVTLAAGDTARGIFKDFYTRLFGLTFVEADAEVITFTQNRRTITLDRNHPDPGRLALLVHARVFGDALVQLRERKLPYELIHSDSGLTRSILLRDPAGNWIHLLETRPF